MIRAATDIPAAHNAADDADKIALMNMPINAFLYLCAKNRATTRVAHTNNHKSSGWVCKAGLQIELILQ